MVSCYGLSSCNFTCLLAQQLSAAVGAKKQKLENILKMAASGKVIESPRKLNLRPLGVESDTERGHHFWNRNVVEMKFSIEHDWMKRVCFAESKPNYRMREVDPVLEGLVKNKLELIGPMLDGFIIEIGL